MTLGILGLYWLQDLLWPIAVAPVSMLDDLWVWASLVWLGAVVPVFWDCWEPYPSAIQASWTKSNP